MKPKIAFVTGGYSGEAEISYKSAITIENAINRNRWEVYKIDIRSDGWFYEGDKRVNGISNDAQENKEIPVNRNDFSIEIDGNKISFDAVLIGIHGTPGEDGKLQGYFDMLKIPYTSCDAATSSLTFNKKYTVAVAASAGINVAKSIHLLKQHDYNRYGILSRLKLPVFVKPNNGGSSIGMSKVVAEDQLDDAIVKAFKEDSQVLIEEFIDGREFTIGVLKSKGQTIPLPITEIIPTKDFFDYEAKYLGASKEVTPAEIDDEVRDQIRQAATHAYEVFNCRGIVRIDFIYSRHENKPYLLEINTVPGQSEASIVPQQVRANGWTLTEFYDALIEDCLRTT